MFVRIEKLDRGTSDLGVEIVRGVTDVKDAGAGDTPQPIVVHLDQAAVVSAHLSAWLDALQTDSRPVVLTVPFPSGRVASVGAERPQLNINLLAIEQQAWMLAARDPRCVVVGTMTELDWGMKNGQISVWAPSKMVLDAVNGPQDVTQINDWFASHMQAQSQITVDAETPNLPL